VSWIFIYLFFYKEVIIYEKAIDDYGFKAYVVCRPDELATYYPYVVVKTPSGIEVNRSQITPRGYKWSNACKNSFPVVDLNLVENKNKLRLLFKGKNAFGDADYVDVSVSFFSPR
jgi:hypothetical protein